MVSPVKTKPACLARPPRAEVPSLEDGFRSVHGTATCLPACTFKSDDLLLFRALATPGVELLTAAGVELCVLVLLVPLVSVVPSPGAVLGLVAPDKEMTANSTRPDWASMMVSLIVPICLPDVSFTWAPIS